MFQPTVSNYKGVYLNRASLLASATPDYNFNNYMNNNSIFDSSNSLNKAQNWTNALAIGMGGLSLAGIILGIVKSFKSSKSSPAKNPDVSDAKQQDNNLETAMDKANKDGDWTPVKEAYDNAVAQVKVNETKSQECQTAIDNANKQIGSDADPTSDKGKIAKYKADNQGYEKDITTLKGQLSDEKAMLSKMTPNDPQRADVEKTIKNIERKIAQNEDKIKQNNSTNIPKLQKDIEDQEKIIKDQTKTKAQLDSENTELQKTIDEAKEKLDEHTGSTTDAVNKKAQDKNSSNQDNSKFDVTKTPAKNISEFDWMKEDPITTW